MELNVANIKKQHAKRIAVFLIDECEKDNELKNKIETTEKTLQGCVDFVFKKAKEQEEDGCAWIDDNIVWGWVKEYYLDDNIKENAVKELKPLNKEVEELKAKEQDTKPKEEPKPVKKPKKPVKEKIEHELTLFDFGL